MSRAFPIAAFLSLALLAPLAPYASSVHACHPVILGDPESEVGHHGCGDPKPTPGPTASGVDLARFDLAARLSIELSAITVVSVEDVTWPDSSIGCPQPGMAYLQVLTPGQRIVLSAAGGTYTYHTGRGRQLVLCSATSPPPTSTPVPTDAEPDPEPAPPSDPALDEPAIDDAAVEADVTDDDGASVEDAPT